MSKEFIFTIIALILFSVFMTDGLIIKHDAADINRYYNENKIYHRLAKSRQDGIFSAGGLGGNCKGLRINATKPETFENYKLGYCKDYASNKSQSGGQGMLFSVIDRLGGGIFVFRAIACGLLAIVLALWFMWISIHFGAVISFLTLLIVLFNRWLIIFATNLNFLLGAYFLVMVSLLWGYEKKIKPIWMGSVVFITVLFEIFLNGFKFLIPLIFSAFIPLVFYAILRKEKIKYNLFILKEGIVYACVVAIAILCFQLQKKTTTLISEATTRNSIVYAKIHTPNPIIPHTLKDLLLRQFSMRGGFMIALIITTILVIPLLKDKLYLALFSATWFSILSPLSWIFVMQGQVATHLRVDSIVWDMPFSLWVTLLAIVTIKKWIIQQGAKIKVKEKK